MSSNIEIHARVEVIQLNPSEHDRNERLGPEVSPELSDCDVWSLIVGNEDMLWLLCPCSCLSRQIFVRFVVWLLFRPGMTGRVSYRRCVDVNSLGRKAGRCFENNHSRSCCLFRGVGTSVVWGWMMVIPILEAVLYLLPVVVPVLPCQWWLAS